jgi:hypothetical protein
LHFANEDEANRAQNTKLFDNIDDILNSDAIEELTQKMKLNVAKGY